MKTPLRRATARDLRNHLPKVMAWIREGESVDITIRGEEIATLVPKVKAKIKCKVIDWEARRKKMREIYGGKTLPGNSVLLMREGSKW